MDRPSRETGRRQNRVWKLKDAKARFSELVRRAREDGPQAVTVRGRAAVVVVDAEDYARAAAARPEPLVTFLESLNIEGLDLTRDADGGRPFEL
ncbi:MAG TPA: type II toxin-antitoxin system prevent-host-death family antitoxin [Caulobacteraceae bacterium]|jgi:prevent-host-death family protein|nr:type II toxin-antitoxin system prevent-host-death family antitoxin [Caulobacteraceae bacterium]